MSSPEMSVQDLASEKPGMPSMPVPDRDETPPVPSSIEDTGLTTEFVSDLILKTLYAQGVLQGTELEDIIRLPFSILDDCLLDLQQRRMVQVRGTEGHGRAGYSFDLTDQGASRARELMSMSAYTGAAPVPIQEYWRWIEAQAVRNRRVSRAEVVEGFRHLVLDEDFIETIGPAINSGRSVFLYGDAGNGKTVIAEAIAEMFGDSMYIPHAILAEGKVIQLYDPVVHEPIEEDDEPDEATSELEADFLRDPTSHDQRFQLVRRPVVIVGGELTLDQLELQHDPETGVFRAPPQVKANGGVFVIDDFGRQRVRPRDLLNRWMYPLERHIDFLALPTGQKLPVPFDTLLIFATNLNPTDLVEEAFLRRIRYKILVDNPTREQYVEIFKRMCADLDLPYSRSAVDFVYENWYTREGLEPRKCHPRDLLNQVHDLSRYRGRTPELSDDLLDRACRTYFMNVTDPDDLAGDRVPGQGGIDKLKSS